MFTRSVPRPSGFYRALHNRSTADAHADNGGPSSRSSAAEDVDCAHEDVYKVDRLVHSRCKKVS